MLVQQGLYKALLDEKLEDMKDDDWKELQSKTVRTIRLSLVLEIKYTVLNETSPEKMMVSSALFTNGKTLYSFEEAVQSADSKKWLIAMVEEME